MWDRDAVDFVSTADMSWSPVGPGVFGGGETGVKKILSASRTGGAETSILRVTSPVVGRLGAAVDLYVLEGHARNGNREVPRGSFVHVPEGAVVDLRPDIGPLTLYCGSFGALEIEPTEAEPADDLDVIDVDCLPWTDMGWRGDEPPDPAVKIKWLRNDDPLGIAFIVAMLPGWRAEQEEKHPVYEESFKIYGDLLLGRRGIVRAGGYFFRHPESWHGPLYSRGGNMSLIRKNAFGATDYRDCETDFRLNDLIERAYRNDPAPSA